MPKKSRKGQHGHFDRKHQPSATANMYTALDTSTVQGSGELNADLVERFNGLRLDPGGTHHNGPSAPIRPNHYLRDYFNESQIPLSGAKWLQKPEIPSPSEIMPGPISQPSNKPKIIDLSDELRPNKILGAYPSKEEYLGTQYDLLREDCIRPLRLAVEEVRTSPYLDEAEYKGGIGVYDPVYLKSIVFSRRGIACKMAFSLGRVKKYVRWAQSKRLITGTLVALSPTDDNFRTKCVLATVAARPLAALDQNPPEIDLFFPRTEDLELDPMQKWVMVEARGSFYEAGRYTMLALQHMMREPFPLSEHLVGVKPHIEPPTYLKQNPYTDMSSLVAMDEEASFRNVNVLEQWPDSNSHSLDNSQSRALKQMVTSRLAVIQGPPGTGKTYTSVVALKILLDRFRNEDCPIILACQTNHAVDQLLRHVAEFEPNFLRLGGRSKDKDVIQKRTLWQLRNSMSPSKARGSVTQNVTVRMKQLTTAMQLLLVPLEANKSILSHKMLVDRELLTPEQGESLESISAMGLSADTDGIHLEQWLGKSLISCDTPLQPEDFDTYEEEDFEVEQLEELEAEATLQDDEFDALTGPWTLLGDNFIGRPGPFKTDKEIRQLLERTSDLYAVPVRDRGTIYNYFKREVKRRIRDEFRAKAREYQELVPQYRLNRWEQDLRVFRGQRIIGMTTTGFSKYRGLIAALRPKVILVEEAAETLEAPVTAACIPSLEHLILVGDHQQLRPHCQVRELEDEPYYLNLSLFERLVLNEVKIASLSRQRRMIPEIRRLLEPIYGQGLRDHPTVADPVNRPPVEGMGGCNSFFFTHEWPESFDANKSALNEKEADMTLGFFDYLFLNGIDPAKITILTFYNGQRKKILKKGQLHQNLRGIRLNVVTVDSYQGEENDIVLLSLVRSNRKYKIGFLDVDNRVCVALSRAKRGFYLFGNAEMLACESAIWTEVVEIMYEKKSSSDPNKRRRLGYNLPLQCENHGRKVFIQEPSDWEYLNGGCDKTCNCQLPCGHKCMLSCHPFPKDQINCLQKCTKQLECGHVCSAQCCEPCKCGMCERRQNGVKPILRSGPCHSRSSPAPTSRNTYELPKRRNGIRMWSHYANGGAQADDAEFMRKKDEAKMNPLFIEHGLVQAEQGEHAEKLIDLSPKEQSPNSGALINTDLIDVDVGCHDLQRPRHPTTHRITYATATRTEDKCQTMKMDLLD